VCLTVSQTHTHTHTHTLRRCPLARAGNSSDDPPVCFRNNLPLRLRHGAVALIQMNHFTNLFPLSHTVNPSSLPPVLSSSPSSYFHSVFFWPTVCYAVDGEEFLDLHVFYFIWLKIDALFASQSLSQSGERYQVWLTAQGASNTCNEYGNRSLTGWLETTMMFDGL